MSSSGLTWADDDDDHDEISCQVKPRVIQKKNVFQYL